MGWAAPPGPVVVDGLGNVYFADNDNNRIIRFGTDGSLNLVAGNGIAAAPGPIDGDGQSAQNVPLGTISGLVVDRNGRLLLGDDTLLAVRAITPTRSSPRSPAAGRRPWRAAAMGGRRHGGPRPRLRRHRRAGGRQRRPVLRGRQRQRHHRPGRHQRHDVGRHHPHRRGQPVDGVPARDSSIGTVSVMACEPTGGLVFDDTDILRRITPL